VGVFLAILLHKPLDAMSITTVMAAGGWSRRARATNNLLFALMCPLGALLFYFGVDSLGDNRDYMVAAALAFSAGTFICIALSDLLPEVHFHSHDRTKLTVAFLLGIGLAYGIGALEPANFHLPSH
jgi:zinc and cadmium transporter